MTLLSKDEGEDIREAVLAAVDGVLARSSCDREVLEVVYVFAAENRETGQLEFYTGGCLPNTKEVRQELLSKAIERVQ